MFDPAPLSGPCARVWVALALPVAGSGRCVPDRSCSCCLSKLGAELMAVGTGRVIFL